MNTTRRFGSEPVTLVVVDPDPVVRRVVRASLTSTTGFVVAAETGDLADAPDLVRAYRADVAVLEARPPACDPAGTVARIIDASPTVAVVLLTAGEDPEVHLDVLCAGASGVLLKAGGIAGMAQALRAVARGELVIPRSLAVPLIQRVRAVSQAGSGLRPVESPLTDREWEVVDLLRAGATPSEVADDLHLERETVYRHLKNVMQKLGVHSSADVVALADRAVRASLRATAMA